MNPASTHEETSAQSLLSQPTYRSFKKKFRKIKIKFDEAMQQNKELFFDEQRAIRTAKRLALQNDQILDILYDVNNSCHIPVEKRIDLTAELPYVSEIPSLVNKNDLLKASQLNSPKAKKIYYEVCNMITARESTKAPRATQKSLALLMASTPHLSSNNPQLSRELIASLEPEEGQQAPYSYITSDQLNEFYQKIDNSQGNIQVISQPPIQELYQDPVFGNFHSPYNWLRRNVPNIFLQDGEYSEKSCGKSGTSRGAGKRANNPPPNKPDSLEVVEDEGISYEFTLNNSKEIEKKRKRDEDYHGNTLKRGTVDENKTKKSRQSRKRKNDSLEEKPTSVKKAKKSIKILSPLPDTHPFGPA